MRFDWTDLQLFVHACDSGSLTGAAQRAHLTLAAVSARIRAMEAGSGALLLQRHSRGVRPTAAGEALARHARAVLEQMAQLRAELARHGATQTTRIRLMANTSALAHAVSTPLVLFLQRHPACHVSVEESASHLSVEALREGAADAAIVSDAVDTQDLATRALGDDPLVLVLPRGHALARLRQPTFVQALDHPWVGAGNHSALHAHLTLQAAQLGKTLPLRASVAHTGAAIALVAAGAGITVLPAVMVDGEAAGVLLKPLAEPWARRRLLLCTRSGPPRPELQALLDCFAPAA